MIPGEFIERLAGAFSLLAETLGGDSLFVSKVLAGQSPRARALGLVTGTTLKDVAVRKRLAEGGAAAIAGSTDPMIRLAYELDPEARALRKRVEDEVESVEHDAYTAIAAARFAIHGENVYPDATNTLRLTFGTVKGYEENGRSIPPLTKFAGLYERHAEREGADPFTLDDRWLTGKDKLDLSVPFNFVCTTDVVGGNSGSPVFNARGEVVGLVFDINLYSLIWNVAFTDRQARTIAVHSRAMIEALRKIYGAGRLADEIVGR
ncbi:MAG: S46 family peptidase [Planctomycetes bacterium]|nr:S46 family peptidase [Planctomycetota bacterium]